MNGELAAIAALAAHGSRWMAMPDTEPPPELLDANSSFQYVRSLTVDLGRSGFAGRRRSAHGTADWLAALRRAGATRLLLVTRLPAAGDLPAHLGSAFANGGSWGLLAQGGAATLWTVQWTIGDPSAPDQRGWDLHATSVPARDRQPAIPDAGAARSALATALHEIGGFAEGAELREWSPWFAKAHALLDDRDPMPPYHQDILPTTSPLQLRQLAAAAVQGWVFGGMGSWNDIWLEDGTTRAAYERVSRTLYDAVVDALAAAVNT